MIPLRGAPLVALMILLASALPTVVGPESSEETVSVHHPIVYRPASLSSPGVPPYTPSDIWKAYDFLPLYSHGLRGNGTRIAVIDAYGDPSLSSDLSTFDSLTGISNGTLHTFYPNGLPKFANSGWALETALDVEWAHAIAPSATIDNVVVPDASVPHIFDGISYVTKSLTNETVLSMSFGLPEFQYPATGPYTIAATHQLFVTMTSHGTTPFASSGDNGAGSCCNIGYPASDPLVVAVGGTTLTLDSNASYVNETAWSGSGAGSSIVFTKPNWQQGVGDSMRDIVDVSYDADLNTGFLVVQGGVEYAVGGTSAGSPQWAGLTALASQAGRTNYGALTPQLYKVSGYHDVTTGNDGFFTAGTGWDYPTGLGTPDANTFVNALQPFNFTINSIPDTFVSQGGSATNIVTVTLQRGISQPVTLSISGLPSSTAASFSGGCTGTQTCTSNPSLTTALIITSSGSAPAGVFSVTVTATGGGQSHATTFFLDVNPQPLTGGGGSASPRA